MVSPTPPKSPAQLLSVFLLGVSHTIFLLKKDCTIDLETTAFLKFPPHLWGAYGVNRTRYYQQRKLKAQRG